MIGENRWKVIGGGEGRELEVSKRYYKMIVLLLTRFEENLEELKFCWKQEVKGSKGGKATVFVVNKYNPF